MLAVVIGEMGTCHVVATNIMRKEKRSEKKTKQEKTRV